MNDGFFDGLTINVEDLWNDHIDLIDYIRDCIAGIDMGDEFDEIVLMKHSRIMDDYIDLISKIDDRNEVG